MERLPHLFLRTVRLAVALGCLLVAGPLAVGAEEPVPSHSGVSDAAEVPAPQERIAMVEIFLPRVGPETGRLIEEDEQVIRIQQIGSSASLVFRKQSLSHIRHFTVSLAKYYELQGDAYAGRLWDFRNDLKDFQNAARAYRESLKHDPAERVRRKYEQLVGQKDRWLLEAARREELRNLVLQRDMLLKKLTAELDSSEHWLRRIKEDLGVLTQGVRRQYYGTVVPARLRPDFEKLRQDVARLKQDVAELRILLQRAQQRLPATGAATSQPGETPPDRGPLPPPAEPAPSFESE